MKRLPNNSTQNIAANLDILMDIVEKLQVKIVKLEALAKKKPSGRPKGSKNKPKA